MAAFLSDEWLAALAEALRRAPDLEEAPRLALGQVVTDVPALEGEGDVRYTLRVGGGVPASVEPGSVEGADVVLVEDYATARELATGTPAAVLLGEGRVKVRGDVAALIAAQEALAGLATALAGVSVGTVFDEDVSESGGPVFERAVFNVDPARTEEFLAAFALGRREIEAAAGCRSIRLLRGVESPDTFILLVEWRTLEDHMVGFRGSPRFGAWRDHVGPFFVAPPDVEHFADAAPPS